MPYPELSQTDILPLDGFAGALAGRVFRPEFDGPAVAAIRAEIGAVAAFKQVDVVPALPKTRSGKILRKTMRGIADGRDEPVPSTIEDAAVLDRLRPILSGGEH